MFFEQGDFSQILTQMSESGLIDLLKLVYRILNLENHQSHQSRQNPQNHQNRLTQSHCCLNLLQFCNLSTLFFFVSLISWIFPNFQSTYPMISALF